MNLYEVSYLFKNHAHCMAQQVVFDVESDYTQECAVYI